MKALVIAATDLRRLLRWRANIFFLFVLPMLIILLLGAAFGGANKARIGVVNADRGKLAQQFVAALRARQSTDVITYTSRGKLESAVAHGDVDSGLIIPANYDANLQQGMSVTLGYVGRPNSGAQNLRATIQSVTAGQSRSIAAAQLIQRQTGASFSSALAHTEAAAAVVPLVRVRLAEPDGSAYVITAGRFEAGASTMLVLFIFLNSLSGAAWVLETRKLGIARRILSTPTSVRTLMAGQLLGRFAIAIAQALIIVFGSLLFFGVSWGNPLGTAAVIFAFSLVGTGAAVLLGSLFSSDEQVRPVALLLGLGLAALGGSMAPLEVFPSTARKIAHITPHAWANDAFSKLLKHGGDLITVLPQIGVLLGFAALAITVGVWQLRRAVTA
jgi:linearmycin/streptolysin S transport system permease protein